MSNTPGSTLRTSLNGVWILDKTRGDWSMAPYLETMQVDPLAIEAHEKGDKETDTIHTIELTNTAVRIVKRSRVNNDLKIDLELGTEMVEYLKPHNRPKKTVARSDHPAHLEIQSSLQTMNHGIAYVTDVKQLLANEGGITYMVQKLTITNGKTGSSHAITRFFKPYLGTAPHLVDDTVVR